MATCRPRLVGSVGIVPHDWFALKALWVTIPLLWVLGRLRVVRYATVRCCHSPGPSWVLRESTLCTLWGPSKCHLLVVVPVRRRHSSNIPVQEQPPRAQSLRCAHPPTPLVSHSLITSAMCVAILCGGTIAHCNHHLDHHMPYNDLVGVA